MSHTDAPDRVLSTLNRDGSRRWLEPKLARGRFLARRRIVAYTLIALFVLLPRLRFGGRPALLIDLQSRELDLFGAVFRPSDGFALALFGLAVVLAVFLVTALFGRVWCGWGCPQSIYLEHVFRPIERWLGGSRGQRVTPWRKLVKWTIYAGLGFALANVFLAYFVGTERLQQWVFESPADHPAGFAVVLAVSALMVFDFGWFREQTCIVACPYGRLQAVMLDQQSLIVGYDTGRGEPRARLRKKLPIAGAGACVDCAACVSVCPTGIDIRDGLQMECIGCAQCIDACDAVMDKLKRPRGLIRYTSKAELAGQPRHMLRARTIIYPALLAAAIALLGFTVSSRHGAELWVERNEGPSFVPLPDGKVSSQIRLKIENETDLPRHYQISLVDAGDTVMRSQASWQVRPRQAIMVAVFVDVPRGEFVHGKRPAKIRVSDGAAFERTIAVTFLGPED